MGYPLQTGAPQLTVNGTQFAIGAMRMTNPFGNDLFQIGVLHLDAGTGWQVYNTGIVISIDVGSNPTLLSVIASCGGIAGFMQEITRQMNTILAHINPAPTPTPPGEPTTENEAIAAAVAGVNALHFTLVNGVPTLTL